MKKYLFGLFAIVLAIGFSAFTPAIHQTKTTVQDPLHWYFVDGSGNIDGGQQYYDTKENVLAVPSICQDGEAPVCMFGSETTRSDNEYVEDLYTAENTINFTSAP